ncbi:MAG: DNA gyrase inhibitor YacG [Pseudomonadota bacterium]|nr:DNA gyrase inhibitor YacG [Pseudomonadota bacterium]
MNDNTQPVCPVCGAPEAQEFRPFCSKRCSSVDLGRWLTGRYRIEVNDPDEKPTEDEPSAC